MAREKRDDKLFVEEICAVKNNEELKITNEVLYGSNVQIVWMVSLRPRCCDTPTCWRTR